MGTESTLAVLAAQALIHFRSVIIHARPNVEAGKYQQLLDLMTRNLAAKPVLPIDFQQLVSAESFVG